MGLLIDDLDVHNIDLQFHAGLERQQGKSLTDYLTHARVTGRVVLGVTDHIELYLYAKRPIPHPNYEQSVKGLQDYRADVDANRDRFPSLHIFFGPEISPGTDLGELAGHHEVMKVAQYFICELPVVGDSMDQNTDNKIGRIKQIGAFMDRTGKPVFIAHPFLDPVNYRLVKRDIEPWVTALPLRPDADFTAEELNRFFMFDIRAVAQAAKSCGVPLEINGGTHNRIRNVNLPTPLQMLRAAYRIIRDEGVDLVSGSDQHGLFTGTSRGGYAVPYDTFEMLGLTAADMQFVKRLIGQKEE